ncbi:MAG TPA: hypothetical protein PKL08_14910, partial [Thermoanaerobaculaceae bacterium]|nr:hypothetical protein [Thermoanaerobaculaceae bacterium]
MRTFYPCKTARAALSLALLALALPTHARAAFNDVGQVNPEITRTDPSIVAWASGVAGIQRGYEDYQQPALGYASYGSPANVLGPSGTPCSLGDGGSITLTFDAPIVNGPGTDFVVFENGFAYNGGVYAEMGFVEVSSDGTHFARLPALCRRTVATGAFDVINPADYYNLGGNYVGGTGIDLQDLITDGDPLVTGGQVDLSNVTYVRLVDVVGDIVGPGRTFDYLGRPVSDPYPTPYASSG